MNIYDWKDAGIHRSSLLLAVQRIRDMNPAAKLAMGTGYASPKVMQECDECAPLLEWMAEQLNVAYSRCHLWCNVLENGQMIGKHNHYQATACGVYYPDDSECPLVFEDDEYFPEAGQMVSFGPNEIHEVPRYEGSLPRVSLSLNLYE